MQFNLNLYKESISDLVNLGLENHYTHAPLCIQKSSLIRDAIAKKLIEVRK